jgi:myo-inositol-1(or 4)-monophosphatase
MNDERKYLDLAIKMAKSNGKTFRDNFGHASGIKKKNNDYRNLVTDTDGKIEKSIKTAIFKKFPNHNCLGEESGWSKKTINNYTWIIDPIDGTTNYIQGLPLCCISIALWDEKGPVLGVVYNPLSESLYYSLRARGAFLNNKKINCSKISELKNAFGVFGWHDPEDGIKIYAKLVRNARKLRVLATSVLTSTFIAEGVLDFYAVKKIKIWDFAAGAAIVTEAGGKITDFQGRPFTINSQSAIVSNGKIHNQLIKILK